MLPEGSVSLWLHFHILKAFNPLLNSLRHFVSYRLYPSAEHLLQFSETRAIISLFCSKDRCCIRIVAEEGGEVDAPSAFLETKVDAHADVLG